MDVRRQGGTRGTSRSLERGALVSVESRSAGQFAGDRLVPHLAIVSREQVTTTSQVEIKRILDEAGIESPFIVSPAVPWALRSAP